MGTLSNNVCVHILHYVYSCMYSRCIHTLSTEHIEVGLLRAQCWLPFWVFIENRCAGENTVLESIFSLTINF